VRRPLAALLLLLAAPAAAGCQTGFDQEKETVRPLKVAHAMGETKVPGQAQRPLDLTAGAADATLALGVRPIGVALAGARLPAYLRGPGRGVSTLPPPTAATLWQARALDPDVILGSRAGQGRLYEPLGDVAPTVMSEGGPDADWKLDLRLFGEALGRTNAAERLLIGWDRRSARARAELQSRAPDRRVVVLRAGRGGLQAAGARSFAGMVLADAGVAGDLPDRAWTRWDGRLPPGGAVLAAGVPPARRPSGAVPVDGSLWLAGDGVLAARAALADLERVLLR
jgi:iron complex transport system substrate-binding protein